MTAFTAPKGAIELRIEAQSRDLGEFSVRRVLPSAQRRMVGPFIFFDHMGPAHFPPGQGIQVRPHPHIGIATVTYLFEGEILHRDSLGCVQAIRAGAVNLMTAGRGIVHSERAGDDLQVESRLHGIQSWMALPADLEDAPPAFAHYPASDLPEVEIGGVRVRVIIGQAYGHHSPVQVGSPTLYLECQMPSGSSLTLPEAHGERAVYVVAGALAIEQQTYPEGVMAVVQAGASVRLEALHDSRIMVIGGEPVGERLIWWNFVASDRDRIEQAKQDWKARRFPAVPGETEFIPLPD